MYIMITGEFYDTHQRLKCRPLAQFAIKHDFEDLQGSSVL